MRHYPPRKVQSVAGGSGYGSRDRALQARFRKHLIERDGLRCWECGKLPTTADPLQAHHVTETDGRMLCQRCHRAVDDYAR